MTIPIARVVATRYASAPVPLRFSYIAHAYRAVSQHRGHPREILQAGIELVGAPGPEGTAEAITVLCAALDAAGLVSYRVGLGDASLFPRALERAGVRDTRPILHELATRRPRRAGARARARSGALELLGRSRARAAASRSCRRASRCASSTTCSAPDVAARVIFDLGLVRTLGYYTGAVFEVYDAALRRADGRRRALRRPARALRARAAGVRLGARRRARARGAAGGGAMRIAVPRGALLKRDARPAGRARHRHAPRSAPTIASCCSRTRG